MKTRFISLWILWSLFGAFIAYLVSSSDSSKSMLSVVAMLLSFSPLLGLMLALGSPKAADQFNDWVKKSDNTLYYIAGGLTVLFAIPRFIYRQF